MSITPEFINFRLENLPKSPYIRFTEIGSLLVYRSSFFRTSAIPVDDVSQIEYCLKNLIRHMSKIGNRKSDQFQRAINISKDKEVPETTPVRLLPRAAIEELRIFLYSKYLCRPLSDFIDIQNTVKLIRPESTRLVFKIESEETLLSAQTPKGSFDLIRFKLPDNSKKSNIDIEFIESIFSSNQLSGISNYVNLVTKNKLHCQFLPKEESPEEILKFLKQVYYLRKNGNTLEYEPFTSYWKTPLEFKQTTWKYLPFHLRCFISDSFQINTSDSFFPEYNTLTDYKYLSEGSSENYARISELYLNKIQSLVPVNPPQNMIKTLFINFLIFSRFANDPDFILKPINALNNIEDLYFSIKIKIDPKNGSLKYLNLFERYEDRYSFVASFGEEF